MLKFAVTTLIFFGLIAMLYGLGGLVYVMFAQGGQVKLFQLGHFKFLDTKQGKQFMRWVVFIAVGVVLFLAGAHLSAFL